MRVSSGRHAGAGVGHSNHQQRHNPAAEPIVQFTQQQGPIAAIK
ncbi:hypothetical protein [Yersinia intermedia]|nr:hypothetical protein [Yersinia intermedia]